MSVPKNSKEIAKRLGDSYHKATDSVDREYVLTKLRGMYKDLRSIEDGATVSMKFSGKNYGVKNDAKGQLKVIKIMKNRIKVLGKALVGEGEDVDN
jgi:hypothetical protein